MGKKRKSKSAKANKAKKPTIIVTDFTKPDEISVTILIKSFFLLLVIEFELRSVKPICKNTKVTEQAELMKVDNGQAEEDTRKIVEDFIDSKNVELPKDCDIPELPPTVSKTAFKAVQMALNAMLWLPLKLASAVQFVLAPALPVEFNLRKLRGKLDILSVEWLTPFAKFSPSSKRNITLFSA